MKTLFVVDDNQTNREVASQELERYYKVLTVPSAAKMFKLAEKILPDLILLDVDMPEMDGYETLINIKKDERLKNVPVVFLTAQQDTEAELRGFELGAVDYVTKPFSPPILLRRIETHLNIDDIVKKALEKAFSDNMTGLRSREYFRIQVDKEFMTRQHESFSALFVIDLDKFKSVNDTYGHQAGDEVIIGCANELKKQFSAQGEMAARIGGDEFAAFMSVAEDEQEVRNRCLALKQAFAEVAYADGCKGIAASIGVCMTGGKTNYEKAFKTADDALYQVKEAGRNGHVILKESE